MQTEAKKNNIFPLGEHFICLDTQRTSVNLTNDVGARIFELNDQGHSEAEIVQTLATEYNASIDQLTLDVNSYLEALHNGTSGALHPLDGLDRVAEFEVTREFNEVESRDYFLSNACIEVRAESQGLISRLDEIFVLEQTLSDDSCSIKLDVFHDRDNWPIVYNGRTLDTGFSIEDTAIKVVRGMFSTASIQRPWRAIFHASSVAKGGRAILFPAIGGSGKTTLAAYLVAKGWKYINDDGVTLLTDGNLLPVTLPLSIKNGSWDVLNPYFPQIEQLHTYQGKDWPMRFLALDSASVVTDPVPCAAVILPHYSPECDSPTLSTISPAEALVAALNSGSYTNGALEDGLLASLVEWLRNKPCYSLYYKWLEDAHSAISEVF